jgi:hypothetical protein
MVAALGLAAFAVHRGRVRLLEARERELARRVEEGIAQIKVLSGLLPICASCKDVRDDTGYWTQLETYIAQRSEADFSHSICPKCMAKLYPDFAATQGGRPQA